MRGRLPKIGKWCNVFLTRMGDDTGRNLVRIAGESQLVPRCELAGSARPDRVPGKGKSNVILSRCVFDFARLVLRVLFGRTKQGHFPGGYQRVRRPGHDSQQHGISFGRDFADPRYYGGFQ